MAALGAVPVAFAATGTAQAAPRRTRTLYIAGDSTAAQKYSDAAPETGWGMALPFFLCQDLAVANHAVNGRSSKSFVARGACWKRPLALEGTAGTGLIETGRGCWDRPSYLRSQLTGPIETGPGPLTPSPRT